MLTKRRMRANICKSIRHAPIAQLDRVTDYESVGRGFESLSAYQKTRYPNGYLVFCLCRKGLEPSKSNSPVGCWASPAGRRCHLTMCHRHMGNESLSAYPEESSPFRHPICGQKKTTRQIMLEFFKGVCYNTDTQAGLVYRLL